MRRCILFLAVCLAIISFFPDRDYAFGEADGHASNGVNSRSITEKGDPDGPVACVQTVPIRKGTIKERLVVYGSVIAAPGALQTVSIPFESRTLSVMVNEGQRMSKGDGLLEYLPSPDTMLQLDQAENAFDLAQESYKQTDRRYNLKLATNEQLLQAKQVLDQARLRLESLRKRGIDGKSKITSSVEGLVKRIYVRQGSIVPAGSPIMDIVEGNHVEALVGIEPEDIETVHPDQVVSLTRVNVPASPAVSGKVREISYAVNPKTRLVDVFVTPTSTAGFLLGESIEGRVVTSVAEGLIVPRSAVLPDGDRHILFTVEKGRAVRHIVNIGIENAMEYQVITQDLKGGEDVVVLGNYELTDGMAVTAEACR